MRGKKTAAEGTNLALPPSQIGFAQLFFVKLALPIFDLGHAAHVKDVKLIGERRSKTHRLLVKKDGDPSLAKLAHRGEDISHHYRRQTDRCLVEHEQSSAGHDSLSYAQHPRLSP